MSDPIAERLEAIRAGATFDDWPVWKVDADYPSEVIAETDPDAPRGYSTHSRAAQCADTRIATFLVAARGDVPDLHAVASALPRCKHCDAFALHGVDERPLSCDACLPYYTRVLAGRTLRDLSYAPALRALAAGAVP